MILSIVAAYFAGKAIYNKWADDVPKPEDITDSTDGSTVDSTEICMYTTFFDVSKCPMCDGNYVIHTNKRFIGASDRISLYNICPIDKSLFIEHFNNKESGGLNAKCCICQEKFWKTVSSDILSKLTKNEEGDYIFKEDDKPLIKKLLKKVELVQISRKVNDICHAKCLAD